MSFHICHPKSFFFKAAVEVLWQRHSAVKQQGSYVTSHLVLAGSWYLGTFPTLSTRGYRHQCVVSLWSRQAPERSGNCQGFAARELTRGLRAPAMSVPQILAGCIPPTWLPSGSVVTPPLPLFTPLFAQPVHSFLCTGLTPSSSCVLPVGGSEQDI